MKKKGRKREGEREGGRKEGKLPQTQKAENRDQGSSKP